MVSIVTVLAELENLTSKRAFSQFWIYENVPGKMCKLLKICFISTASGALVVGGVRDICSSIDGYIPEIGLSVQWSRTNQSVAVCGSLW